jgi:hypothetical protein
LPVWVCVVDCGKIFLELFPPSVIVLNKVVGGSMQVSQCLQRHLGVGQVKTFNNADGLVSIRAVNKYISGIWVGTQVLPDETGLVWVPDFFSFVLTDRHVLESKPLRLQILKSSYSIVNRVKVAFGNLDVSIKLGVEFPEARNDLAIKRRLCAKYVSLKLI